MNKKITSSVLAALLVAGSTSFSALAAMANGTVVIGTKAFDLAYANNPANAAEITNAVVAANGAIFVKDFEGNWINNATGLKVLASVIPAVTYKSATGVVTSFNAGDKDVVTKLEVTSVSAINATQLKVVFTQEVDKTDAELATNYKIGGYLVTASLQSDAKTVILTANAQISGTNLYVVNPIKLATDSTVKSAIFTFVETYADNAAPVVLNVTYPTYDKAKVTFSEPLSSLGTVTVTQNGAPLALSLEAAFVPGSSSITYDLAPAAVLADKAITIVFVGAKDTGNNLITPNPTTITLLKTKTDTTAPTISEINVLSDTRVSVTFNEKLVSAPTVIVGGNTVSFAAIGSTTDNITWTGTFASTTGVKAVAVSAFTDMSGNTGATSSVLKQVTADTTKPTLVSSEVKTFNSNLYLVLHYSEAVDAVMGGKIITGTTVKDYVSTAFTTTVTPIAYTKANGADIDDTKSVMVDLSTAAFPVGAYTVTIPTSFVQDKASTTLYNDAATIAFTKGTVTANDTTAPTVNALPLVSSNNKYVTVTFSEAMDYATTLNVANYKVSGQTIFTNAIFDGDNKTVKLTVAPGTVTYSGARQVTVSGVKDLAGNLNTAYSNIVTFAENVAPYVASAKLESANTIKVTFSESVAGLTSADFDVYIGGVLVVATTQTSLVPTATATITLAAPITDLSKAIQVKLVNAATSDVNGNTATINQLVTAQ